MKKLLEQELWKKAREGDISILSDPRVSKLIDRDGETPLHVLAMRGKYEILKHPDVDKVQNYFGNTPLHLLLNRGSDYNIFVKTNIIRILKCGNIEKIRNNKAETPFDWLCQIRYSGYSRKYLEFVMKLLKRKKINA